MSETDREKWRGRINRAWMESSGHAQTKGLAILAGIIDGLGADLSNLMEAHLEEVKRANKETVRAIRSLKDRDGV